MPMPLLFLLVLLAPAAHGADLERIGLAQDKRGFELSVSGRPFFVWGLNYDHDERGRLLEDYWIDEWAKVESDFAEMKQLGANVVRVHLQFGKFMETCQRPNTRALEQLTQLLSLAQRTGLYLDVTGLGCYHKRDVPPWYDSLPVELRWRAQARFWEAIAQTCAKSKAIFCYDLMNEPVVSAGDRKDDWLGTPFAGKHFVQFITRDPAQNQADVARRWIDLLAASIRKHDQQALVTVGLVPWSLDRPGLRSGFVPQQIAGGVDFVAVHVYPQSKRLSESIELIKAFGVRGKPLLVEETFSLECSPKELGQVMDQARGDVAGWIGFYWGQTEEECRRTGTIAGAITADWLKLFRTRAKQSPN